MRPLTLIIILLVQLLFAQDGKNNCTKAYFKNGKISTTSCYFADKYGGQALAYNQKGEIIGEWHVSRMHQLSSVHFTYHANGGVYKAEYSSHPDAGIQWYRSTTTYNEAGVKVDFWQMSHDDLVTFYDPNKIDLPPSNPPPSYNNYTSELWIDNRSNRNLIVRWKPKSASNFEEIMIKKSERKKVTEQKNTRFLPPANLYDIEISKTNRKSAQLALDSNYFVQEDKKNPKTKVYLYSTKNVQ